MRLISGIGADDHHHHYRTLRAQPGISTFQETPHSTGPGKMSDDLTLCQLCPPLSHTRPILIPVTAVQTRDALSLEWSLLFLVHFRSIMLGDKHSLQGQTVVYLEEGEHRCV